MNDDMKKLADQLSDIAKNQKILSESFDKLEKEKAALDKKDWWEKHGGIFITAALGAFATIIVALLSYLAASSQDATKNRELEMAKINANAQTTLKDSELTIAKVEKVEKLIALLSSHKPGEKKFAVFAIMSMGIGDFDKFVLSSLTDSEDKDTLDALLEKIQNREDLKGQLKALSRFYSEQAELAYENGKDAYELAEFALRIYPKNAQANYRVARKLQTDRRGSTDPVDEYNKALANLKDGENAYAKPDLEISVNERLGQYYYFDKDDSYDEEGKKRFQIAYNLLNAYQDKDENDVERLKILEGCIKSKEDCDFK